MTRDPAEIEFRGVPTRPEWGEILSFVRSNRNAPNPRILAFGWLVGVLVGAVLAMYPDSAKVGWVLVGASSFFAWRSWTTDARSWRAHGSQAKEFWGALSDTGIEMRSAGIEVSIAWERLVRAGVGNDALVIETEAGEFQCLTRSMFGDVADWQDAKSLVGKKLPKASKIWSNPPGERTRLRYWIRQSMVFLGLLLAFVLLVVLTR